MTKGKKIRTTMLLICISIIKTAHAIDVRDIANKIGENVKNGFIWAKNTRVGQTCTTGANWTGRTSRDGAYWTGRTSKEAATKGIEEIFKVGFSESFKELLLKPLIIDKIQKKFNLDRSKKIKIKVEFMHELSKNLKYLKQVGGDPKEIKMLAHDMIQEYRTLLDKLLQNKNIFRKKKTQDDENNE